MLLPFYDHHVCARVSLQMRIPLAGCSYGKQDPNINIWVRRGRFELNRAFFSLFVRFYDTKPCCISDQQLTKNMFTLPISYILQAISKRNNNPNQPELACEQRFLKPINLIIKHGESTCPRTLVRVELLKSLILLAKVLLA